MLVPLLALDAPHARAALRVEVAQAVPGKPFLAAVEIVTDPHWHVYWRNPGDSGVATRITWGAPKGWKVEPLEFPIPRRFSPGGIAAYGYEGKTLFLARVTPSRAPGVLTANASWLVCSETCVQGGASLKTTVKLGARPILTPTTTALQRSRRDLPQPAKGWTLRAAQGTSVVLAATPGRSAPSMGSLEQAEFFPAQSGAVDQAKPLLATLQGQSFVFKMDVSPFPEKRAALSGLIVFTTKDRRWAVSVNPKLKTGE